MKRLVFCLLAVVPAMAFASQGVGDAESDEDEGGFFTSYLNEAMNKAMNQSEPPAEGEEKVQYGRDITKYVTAPQFSGYVIGRYRYSSQDGAHNGAGFDFRNVRVSVTGTVLKDFAYKIQMELAGSPHIKDVYIEWQRFKELHVKFGQYKRNFTFENPYNPWDIGLGDYSQAVRKLAGYSDYTYSEGNGNNGGRDIGLLLSGDLFKVNGGRYRLVHYEAGVYNGQGINTSDSNGKKDWIGLIALQPVEGLMVGVSGWKGSITADGVTVPRNRWSAGVKYEHKNWSARAEYLHHSGHKTSDYVAAQDEEPAHWKGNARADGWYATVGVPCLRWLKVYAKYDAYRADATNGSLCTMYSLCPNFQLHKNLMFQVQYNYMHDKTSADRNYHELWCEAYIRF